MRYKVLPADTIYVDKFHLASEYLLAESELNRIIVLAAEYSVGGEFNLSDVKLFNTIHDEVYGDMDIYRNIHLPYLHNVKPFFDWMVKELEDNSLYAVIKGRQLSYTNFQEVLHNCIIDPTKPCVSIRRPHLSAEDVIAGVTAKEEVINRFECIDYDLFNHYTEKIMSEGEYNINMGDNRDYDTNEIKRFIEYAIVESLVGDFFPAARKDIYKFHNEGVERTIKDFAKSEAYQTALPIYEKLCDKLVPSGGPAKTKGGEFLRGVMRIIYHMYNDGDSFVSFMARQTSFWAFVNCVNTIISNKENYQLYQDIIPEVEKKRNQGYTKLCIENDADGWLIIDMVLFAIRYVETEEGKSDNTEEKYIGGYWGGNKETVVIDFISPLHETISGYDNWVPNLEDQFC